ncbi:hypothetical protein D3C81_1507770 [compost metagenome]
MSEYAEIIDAHSQHAREEVLAWAKSGLEVRRWNSVNPLTLERIIALAEDFDALAIEAQALRDQVKALQSDANSWQSGYDEGRRMGTKHRQSEVDQLTREVEALRARVVVDEHAEFERLFSVYKMKRHHHGTGGYTDFMTHCVFEAFQAGVRLNGKTVSEGLLREAKRHLGNWLELHCCECEGGLHYCGRDQVAKTHRELRALLGEGQG